MVRVDIKTAVTEVAIAERNFGSEEWRQTAGLSEKQTEIIKFSKENGILEAFQQTVIIERSNEVPRCMERFFLGFLKIVIPKVIPKSVLNILIKKYKGGKILFLIAHGIGLLIVSGKIRLFIPASYVVGKAISGSKGRLRTEPDEDKLIHWLMNTKGHVTTEVKPEMLGITFQ